MKEESITSEPEPAGQKKWPHQFDISLRGIVFD